MDAKKIHEWFRIMVVVLMVAMILLGSFTKCTDTPPYVDDVSGDNNGGFITIDTFEQGDTFTFDVTVWD